MPTQPVPPTLVLSRFLIEPAGAFGRLHDGNGLEYGATCERVFDELGATGPVVPPGSYRCVRGVHRLSDGVPFETFEITGVAGHAGILFHRGNTELDSHGCVLLGRFFDVMNGKPGVWESAAAFTTFMQRMDGIDEFMLTVESLT